VSSDLCKADRES